MKKNEGLLSTFTACKLAVKRAKVDAFWQSCLVDTWKAITPIYFVFIKFTFMIHLTHTSLIC